MRRSTLLRLTVLAVVLLVSAISVTQSFGSKAKEPAAVAATAQPAGPNFEWAVMALVFAGALVYLIRPRRRTVYIEDPTRQ